MTVTVSSKVISGWTDVNLGNFFFKTALFSIKIVWVSSSALLPLILGLELSLLFCIYFIN